MGDKRNIPVQSGQMENLRNILRGLGINTQEELDNALSDALKALTLGIMTDTITRAKNSA